METRRELIEAVGERYRQSGMRTYLKLTRLNGREIFISIVTVNGSPSLSRAHPAVQNNMRTLENERRRS
jgi:hypothetical protein